MRLRVCFSFTLTSTHKTHLKATESQKPAKNPIFLHTPQISFSPRKKIKFFSVTKIFHSNELGEGLVGCPITNKSHPHFSVLSVYISLSACLYTSLQLSASLHHCIYLCCCLNIYPAVSLCPERHVCLCVYSHIPLYLYRYIWEWDKAHTDTSTW